MKLSNVHSHKIVGVWIVTEIIGIGAGRIIVIAKSWIGQEPLTSGEMELNAFVPH